MLIHQKTRWLQYSHWHCVYLDLVAFNHFHRHTYLLHDKLSHLLILSHVDKSPHSAHVYDERIRTEDTPLMIFIPYNLHVVKSINVRRYSWLITCALTSNADHFTFKLISGNYIIRKFHSAAAFSRSLSLIAAVFIFQ